MKQLRSIPPVAWLLLAIVFVPFSCNRNDTAAADAGKKTEVRIPVRVAKAELRSVPLVLEAIGNVEADSSVAVKSRVIGQLQKVFIRDGQEVKEGDVLFQLDPAPFAEEVRLAEANIARDIATEKQAAASALHDDAVARNARATAKRWASLMEQGIVAKEQADNLKSQADAADASLASNQAAIESARAARRADEARLAEAKLQLAFTTIRAPITGRAGFIAVKEGNLVKDNDATLVTLLRVQPIFVTFAVPEQSLPDIRLHMAAGPLAVDATTDGGARLIATGQLSSIDSSVDTSTGTIKLKASFGNADRVLWPGQFITVRLKLKIENGVVAIPERAVLTGQRGPFVWVAKADGTAENRDVKVARRHADLSILTSGLSEGEIVVVEGQLRVTRGAKLEIQGQNAATVAAETKH